MATGVTDAFYEPMQGIMRGPEEFAEGVIRGGRSLGSNVLYGVTDSISKMTGSLAKGVAELSMDKEYLEKRRAMTSASNAADVPRSGRRRGRTTHRTWHTRQRASRHGRLERLCVD